MMSDAIRPTGGPRTTSGRREMILESHKAKRGLAITAGITAIAAGAALNVTHLVEGGQPLVSPMTAAILALALGAVAAALVVSEAWRSGRRTLASCLVLSIVAGEGFGLIMGAERLLFVREERQRAVSEVNTGRWIATVRVEFGQHDAGRHRGCPAQGNGQGRLQKRMSGVTGRSRAGAPTARGGQQGLAISSSGEEHSAARRDTPTSYGAPGDRASAAVFDGAEWACVHTARVRRPRTQPRRRGGTGRASYPGAASAGPGGAGAVLCRSVPKTARSRSELQ